MRTRQQELKKQTALGITGAGLEVVAAECRRGRTMALRCGHTHQIMNGSDAVCPQIGAVSFQTAMMAFSAPEVSGSK
jgi:hypothetical protein